MKRGLEDEPATNRARETIALAVLVNPVVTGVRTDKDVLGRLIEQSQSDVVDFALDVGVFKLVRVILISRDRHELTGPLIRQVVGKT